ncbi:MAG: filamentous hemagglutinin family protein, partial [Methylomonas lenta]|nr:filamentous hemagglutinin family protein [Methylomonas lenta]
MFLRQQLTYKKYEDSLFRLKPLVAYMRVALAGGMLFGAVKPATAELPVPSAGWVHSGMATNQIIGNTLRIDQQTDKAILNWDKFNVGKENTVQFVQPNSTSIALNRINQEDPSRILGQIIANGQVYLYNRNGFVFGESSVVNTNSFLASTLNITDEVFNRGITRVFDEDGRPALAVDGALNPATSKILIEAGAKINVDKAGRIILAAPTIDNQGSLTAGEQGQIIVAASQDKVYLQAADKDSPFAGLVVEVDTGGQVTNTGDISVRQGNVTLAGFSVNQAGRVSATTSVNVNGSIRLLAEEGHATNGAQLIASSTTRDVAGNDGLGTKAKLTFGAGSVTQIVADSDTSTTVDELKQPQSYLEATAHTIEMQSHSAIVAPSGNVNLTATDNIADPTQGTEGRIYLDQNALIDASGTANVPVAMERNVAQISVQSYELRNSPLQLNGVLKGADVLVDIRKDNPIIDTSGANARIARGIDERLTTGGTINMRSSGDVIINDGATINIAGGSVQYQDGYISSTKLLNDYNRIVDISKADPNEHYKAIYGEIKEVHTKWGVTKVWDVPGQYYRGLFEKGYTEGKSAGSFTIATPELAWNGTLVAGSQSGLNQRKAGKTPFGGSFEIDLAVYNSVQNVRLQTENSLQQLAITNAFPTKEDGLPEDLVLAAAVLNDSGVGSLDIKTLGSAEVIAGTTIALAPLGSLAISANSIAINGIVQAPGGAIDLNASQVDLGAVSTNPALGKSSGDIVLAANGILDVSGRWINDFPDRKSGRVPTDILNINGGSISLQGQGDVVIDQGSSVTANAGAWLSAKGKFQGGDGGSISLAAVGNASGPSALHLDGTLSAYGFNNGGSLSLSSSSIVIGTADINADSADSLNLAVHDGHFDFASQLGFSTINLIGNYAGIEVKQDAALDLKTYNYFLRHDIRGKATGTAVSELADIVLLPEHLRQPLTLNLGGAANVELTANSTLTLDKGSTINLSSSAGSIFVDGVVNASAGAINLAINPASGLEYDNTQTIWLGQHAQLLAQGDTRMNPIDMFGRNTGTVLNGGTVTLDANRGSIVLEKGSVIDVSGTHGQVDILQSGKGLSAVFKTKDIGSDAGSITLTAAEGMVLEGNMRAVAGSVSNSAGRLELILDRSARKLPDPITVPFPSGPLVINLRQTTRQSLADKKYGDQIDDSLNGQANISADQIMAGGFADVRLKTPDTVSFIGNVNLRTAARIDIDSKVVDASAAGAVNLDSGYLKLGSSFVREIADQPLLGDSQFTAHAKWIELQGGSLWDGFANVSFSSEHDLRTVGLRTGSQRDFLGTLVTAANLNLQASQIYPSTLSSYSFVVANNPDGQINISGANTDASPLSAAGSLSFSAPVINQHGVLKAPLGSISLLAGKRLTLAEGSVTSVSAAGQIIPFGVVQSGLDWLYPLVDPLNLVYDTPPSKQVMLSGPEVVLEKNSTVDISGGGDLLAYEFKPTADGFPDYLQPGSASYEGSFAVLPNLGSSLAPFDQYQSTGWNYQPGSRVYLNGSDQLAAGYYTILPPHYALLPGAFLVTPQANSIDQTVTTLTKDSLPIISGYQMLASNGAQDSRTSGYRIESATQMLAKHPQYDIYTANDFYAQKAATTGTNAPLLPMDSGQISIVAQTKLLLDGLIDVAAPGGRGAKMNIAANNIKVVNQLDTVSPTGVLEILDSDLNNLRIDSLLLGGNRTINASNGQTDMTVLASNVTFDSGVNLTATSMTAAATDKIEVKSGAHLSATGSVNTGDFQFNIVGDGALLRLSADKQIVLNRSGQTGAAGDLLISSDASLLASKSMFMEATKSTTMDGDILMQGGSLNMTAGSINLGEGGAGNALNLSADTLAKLTVDELVLSSRGNVNLYGNLSLPTGLPLKFGHLTIDAAGLAGFATNSQVAKLQADQLTLQNSQGVTGAPATGVGRLELTTSNYLQGAGQFGMDGFNSINIAVGNGFTVADNSSLNLGADTNIQAGYLTALGGNTLGIDAGNHALQVTGNGTPFSSFDNNALGGGFDISANSILFDTNAVLHSGQLALHALTGDVVVGSDADINLHGLSIPFVDQYQNSKGGTFTANAEHGQVLLASGSSLNLGVYGDGVGGSLVLKAPEQSVSLNGLISAVGASALIDEENYAAGNGFDQLMTKLVDADIHNAIDFRLRGEAGIAINNDISAYSLTLTADKGAIDVFAALRADASVSPGDRGNSSISLYAGDKIILENGGKLFSDGKILLSSVDGDQDGISGIATESGSLIDAGSTGQITFRTLRTADGVNIDHLNGALASVKPVYAVGVETYTDSNSGLFTDGSIDGADIDSIKADTDTYMTSTNINNVFNLGGKHLNLMAGVEIDHSGNLALNDSWDLAGWRYNGKPGELTIKASGDLLINQSLSDGFTSQHVTFNLANKNWDILLGDKLMDDDSWSYTLSAGSDIASANSNSTLASGNLVVGSNAKIRTGTGDMQINAGGDISFSAGAASVDKKLASTALRNRDYLEVRDISGWEVGAYLTTTGTGLASGTTITSITGPVAGKYKVYLSVRTLANVTTSLNVTANYTDGTIYSAGQASASNPFGSLGNPAVALNYYSEFPVNGGNLSLNAGGNINGRITGKDFNDWLLRMGDVNSQTGVINQPTAWGIAFGFVQSTAINTVVLPLPSTNANIASIPSFQQNIGSFGGGNVSVKAVGDIANLEVMMPTTGKPVGNNTDAFKLDGFTSNEISVNGSGNLLIDAGGNVLGGSYFLGSGDGVMSANGQVSAGTQYSNGPVLYGSSNSHFNIEAATGVQLSGMFDPMIAHSGNVNFFSPDAQYNSLTVTALSGDIVLSADNSDLAAKYKLSSTQATLAEIYPASLQVAALGGSVLLQDSITLFPSANGQLNIFAANDISAADGSGSYYLLGMSDADISLLPSLFSPVANTGLEDAVDRISPYGLAEFIHAQSPIHANDSQPVRLVTLQGDIANIGINSPKKALLRSGRDISNIALAAQNINADDVTIVDAGRDLVFPSDRDPLTGGLTQRTSELEALNEPGIKVAGPGEVYLKSGRDIDFGASNGLSTVANTYNTALSATGAEITLFAGLNGATPDYAGFIAKYFAQAEYANDLALARSTIIDFMKNRTGNAALSDDDALLAFSKLPSNDYLTLQPKLNAWLVPVYMSEVRLSGRAAAAQTNDYDKKLAYERGSAAIESFFPGKDWQGDLSLYFSKLQTLKGGDINLLVPGGEINAGLAVSVTGAKSADKLGIVAQREGSITAVLRDDFLVNKSRVFALSGGDIMIWSSDGNIDAGKGAKSSISAPPPIITVDKNGNLSIEFPPIVSGSGIRTAGTSDGNVNAGNVDLFAPVGVVDAGEAGIGGTNVTISATAVLGANNIQVSGVGTGVPVASSGSVAAGLTGASGLSAAVNQVAQDSVNSDVSKNKNAMNNTVLGMLSVEVVGFG